MPREKPYFREVVADLVERSGGKMSFNCRSIMQTLKVGRAKALAYLEGEKNISIYDLARKMLQ